MTMLRMICTQEIVVVFALVVLLQEIIQFQKGNILVNNLFRKNIYHVQIHPRKIGISRKLSVLIETIYV